MAEPGKRLSRLGWIAAGAAAAVAAVALGVALGSAADEDRRETTVEGGPTTTAPPAGASTTTTATPLAASEQAVANGFYMVLASESDDEAGHARLAGLAAGVEGALVTSTSRYTNLPGGDPRIGQPPLYLPAGGVAVAVVGPHPLPLALETCSTRFDGDCLVRQLTTEPLLDEAPAGLTTGAPDGFDWPHPDHPAFPFPLPSRVRGGIDDDEDCAADDEDDEDDEDDGDDGPARCLTTYRFRVEVEDEAVTAGDVLAFLDRFGPATGWTASAPPTPTTLGDDAVDGRTFLHSCGDGCHASVGIEVSEADRDRGPRLEVLLTFDDR